MSSSPVEEFEVQSTSVQNMNTYDVQDVICETGYTTGDPSAGGFLVQQYSSTDEQCRKYKKQFDKILAVYKNLCADMDDISDQMKTKPNTLSEESTKFQAVAEEYHRLKDLKWSPEDQIKQQQCEKQRQELFPSSSWSKLMMEALQRGSSLICC